MRYKRAIGILGFAVATITGGFLVGRARAGIPTTNPTWYAGYLDQNGVPADGQVTLGVAVYDAATGGNVLCQYRIAATTVSKGRFRVPLAGCSTAAFDAAVEAWTEVDVVDGGSVVPLLPRSKIGAVPYANVADVATMAHTLEQTPAALGGVGGIGDVVASFLTPTQFAAQRGAGWVLCDGSVLTGTALGTLTGMVSIPDLRGQFLRGFNNGRNDGNGDADGDAHGLREAQADQFASHTHTIPPQSCCVGTGSFGPYQGVNGAGGTESASAGGNETRPRNIAVNFYCRVN